MSIAENLHRITKTLPPGVKLVAVSKTHSVEEIMEAYQTGQRCFAENKAQELSAKQPLLPSDIEWHFIGHLQSNKVKYIAPFVSLIHSVDSLKLLQVIDKEASKNGRTISCLLQFHIAEEDTKFGLDIEEAEEILESKAYRELKNISIAGIMGMATFTDDYDQVRREFRHLKAIFDQLKGKYFAHDPAFREISMGMSDDYEIAVSEGSTLVRIGSSIFGARIYT
ncbi:uncharacterized pyridoxal phosphate-containing protein, affects Ilv metabolism, UPF0001 family [Bacteroidales bacterium 6E]|nr:uncharacterized pyridoxal phosphate-containing protein, affects Ilv metabolism, UPF0001 family [Bacteroidales bacterium 6E]